MPELLTGSRKTTATGLSTIPEAIAAIGRGEIIIVVDDDDRENEGDFVMAAEHATAAHVNFMIRYGRGLVCAPLTGGRCDDLDLTPMVEDNRDPHGTAFTVSIDLADDASTGISAGSRAATIRALLDPHTRPDHLRRPGHIFPLRARPGGVLERAGHTEASVDLARLAGLAPAGVICEIMNPDGSMARLPDLLEIADEYGMHLITVADLVTYRRRTETHLSREATATLPTSHGPFDVIAYRSHLDGSEHIALVLGDVEGGEGVLTRVHSECLTGDVLGSTRCDCGPQLDDALAAVADEGRGVVVYVRGHEGRGIGLVDKVRAYALQDAGADTVEANVELGHPADRREYSAAAQILRDLGVESVRLLTNNPTKHQALAELGTDVEARVPLPPAPTADNVRYLATKRDKLGHQLDLEPDRVERTTA